MNNSTCLRKLKFWHNFRLTLLELELFIASLPLIGQAFADVGPQHRRLLPRRRRGVGGAEGRVGGGTDGAGGVAHQPPEATDGRALAAAELAAALRHRAGVAARPAQAEHGLRRRDAADGARPRPAARRRPLGVVVAAQRCQQIALAGRYRRLDRVLPSFFFLPGFPQFWLSTGQTLALLSIRDIVWFSRITCVCCFFFPSQKRFAQFYLNSIAIVPFFYRNECRLA